MKKLYVPLILLFAVAIGALKGAPLAHATSIVDGTVINTDKVILSNQFNPSDSNKVDVTLRIINIIKGTDTLGVGYNAMTVSMKNDFSLAVESGRYAISVQSGYATVQWSNTNAVILPCAPNTSFTCGSSYGFAVSTNDNTTSASLQFFQGNPLEIYAGTPSPVVASNNPVNVLVFKNTYPVTYPAGYVGQQIGLVKTDYHPNFTYTTIGTKVQAHYSGPKCIQNGSDNSCSEFNLLWTFSNPGGDGYTVSLPFGTDFSYDSPTNGSHGLFLTLVNKGVPYRDLPGIYNYLPTQVNLNLDGSSSTGTTVDCVISNGFCESNSSLFTDCATNSFPFVDVPKCMKNIGSIFTLISFNGIKFNNDWSSTTDCKQLGTLGNWLHTPGITLCPQFNAEIRNIVTPFVTFLLGLLTITFISRNKGSQW